MATGPLPDLVVVRADDRFARPAPIDRTIALDGDAVAPAPQRGERNATEAITGAGARAAIGQATTR
jgi:hypothetical protein